MNYLFSLLKQFSECISRIRYEQDQEHIVRKDISCLIFPYGEEQQTAEAAAEQLVRNISEARKLPVESFYPHKLEIYENSALRCGELMRQKLFLASFSVAEGASLGVENVKADTKRKMKELNTYFERYKL